MANKKKILLLAPSCEGTIDYAKDFLEHAGFEVTRISDDAKAREYLLENKPDAIFVDCDFKLDPSNIKTERDIYFDRSDRDANFGGVHVAHQIRDEGFTGPIKLFANTWSLAKHCETIIKDMQYKDPIDVLDVNMHNAEYVLAAEELFGKQKGWQKTVKETGSSGKGGGVSPD